MLVKNPKPIISLNMLRIINKQFNVQKLMLHLLYSSKSLSRGCCTNLLSFLTINQASSMTI